MLMSDQDCMTLEWKVLYTGKSDIIAAQNMIQMNHRIMRQGASFSNNKSYRNDLWDFQIKEWKRIQRKYINFKKYSDTPFGVILLDLWEPGDIPDWYGSHKILTCLDFMTEFGIGASIGMREVT